ncbi:MAG TPA: hypothetical protein VI451_14350 [Anaerolineales bacterium]|nr:hypothetical protein [Anaerolineales bacterium]
MTTIILMGAAVLLVGLIIFLWDSWSTQHKHRQPICFSAALI